MFDLFGRDTVIIAPIIAAAVLIMLPIQLTLCFRAKKPLFKLLPAALSAAAVLVFYGIAITAKDWSAFGYLILAAASGIMLIFSGIGWGIWAIAGLVRKSRQEAHS